ncbi:MAG TPA: hypothetical protein VLP30_03750, partial [Desulfatirhabdiaceae bacterium]|nr:hypothetical protein [Desulfatirhabdiaceae bacterium]
MSAPVNSGNSEINPLLREADLYLSMGLYEESLKIYTELISRSSEMDSKLQNSILQRISSARQHLHVIETEIPSDFSTRDLSILQQSQALEETVQDIMESAQALV